MKVLTALLLIGAILPLQGCRPAATPAVFDVPSLLSKDIKAVEAQLGPPSSTNEHGEVAKLQKSDDAFKRWNRATAALVIHYGSDTGKVKHFALDGFPAPKGSFSNEEEAMSVGNLQRDDPRYSLDFIKSGSAGRVWMVRITPKP